MTLAAGEFLTPFVTHRASRVLTPLIPRPQAEPRNGHTASTVALVHPPAPMMSPLRRGHPSDWIVMETYTLELGKSGGSVTLEDVETITGKNVSQEGGR